MKKTLLLLTIFFVTSMSSQVHVSSDFMKYKRIKQKDFEEFKKRTLLFVIPDDFDLNLYEEILNEVWTVSNVLVIKRLNLNFTTYLTGQYSFAFFNKTMISVSGKVSYGLLFHSLDISILEDDKLLEKINKYYDKHKKRKKEIKSQDITDLIIKHEKPISRINFFYNSKGLKKSIKEDFIVSDYHNYGLGDLKNSLQKINNSLQNNKGYSSYDDVKLPEVKELKNKTLYVPDHLAYKFKKFSGKEELEENRIKDLFSDYDFEYKILPFKEINNKILRGDEFYYLKYSKVNADKYIEIINSITGVSVYLEYKIVAYNIKNKDIKRLSKAISKK